MSSPGGPADLSFLLDFQPQLTGVDSLVGEIQKLTREVHMTMLQEAIEVVPTLPEVPKGFGVKFAESIKAQLLESGGLQTIMAGLLGGNLGGAAGAAVSMGGNILGGAAGGELGAVFGSLAGSLVEIPGQLKSLFDKFAGFSALASPATFKQFMMAIEDTQAVMGHAFLPVLEMSTKVVKLFGDVLMTILPSSNEMREATRSITIAFKELESIVREITSEIGPILHTVLLTSIVIFAEGLRTLTMLLRPLLALLLNPLGLFTGTGGGALPSSTGAAARPAAISGIEEYQKQLQTSAYALPSIGEVVNYPQKQLEAMNNIEMLLKNPQGLLVRIFDSATKAVDRAIERATGISPDKLFNGVPGRHDRIDVGKASVAGTVAGMHL